MMDRASHKLSPRGLMTGSAAYLWWGTVVPLFYHALRHVHAVELLALRAVTGLPVLAVLIWALRRRSAVGEALRDRKAMGMLLLSALLLATNWFTFIYAVATERVLEVSLGYYINPLVSIALGMAVLGERLRGLQAAGVALAMAAVGFLVVQHGSLPWIALTVALSFGFYGLVRKQTAAGPIVGLTIEMAMLTPLAIGAIAVLASRGSASAFVISAGETALMMLSGVVTILPLLWFNDAAKRLPLSTLGFLQYLGPTGQFVLALLVFGEALRWEWLTAFVLIWSALALVSYDAARRTREGVPAAPAE